jgi:hypothetical protein
MNVFKINSLSSGCARLLSKHAGQTSSIVGSSFRSSGMLSPFTAMTVPLATMMRPFRFSIDTHHRRLTTSSKRFQQQQQQSSKHVAEKEKQNENENVMFRCV